MKLRLTVCLKKNLFHPCDTDLFCIDDSYCNLFLFNGASPFADMSIDNPHDDIMPLETRVNGMLEINIQFKAAKNTEEVSFYWNYVFAFSLCCVQCT